MSPRGALRTVSSLDGRCELDVGLDFLGRRAPLKHDWRLQRDLDNVWTAPDTILHTPSLKRPTQQSESDDPLIHSSPTRAAEVRVGTETSVSTVLYQMRSSISSKFATSASNSGEATRPALSLRSSSFFAQALLTSSLRYTAILSWCRCQTRQ